MKSAPLLPTPVPASPTEQSSADLAQGRPSSPLKILSLGAGVQSTALLLMSCKGVLPKLDAAIFADTQWEPASVYTHLDWLEGEAANAGIPVHRVTAGSLREAAMRVRTSAKSGNTYIAKGIPAYLRAPDGKLGLGTRQCTLDFKIVPVDRFCRSLKSDIEMWMGITVDEIQRMKGSRKRWKSMCYPFLRRYSRNEVTMQERGECSYLPTRWTREMCLEWLRENYPGRNIPRSACITCPYHSNTEWRRLRDEEPDAWQQAIEDEGLLQEAYSRATAVRGKPFLHRSGISLPLAQIDMKEDPQTELLFGMQNECAGMCGV